MIKHEETYKMFFLLLLAFSMLGCTAEQTNSETITASSIQTDNKQSDNKEKDIASILSKTDNIENSSILNIYYIDVGQGDACLLEYNNYFILIDAGDNDAEQLMVDFLTDKGVDKLDYVFATHPHADHIGGLDAVIDNFPIDEIYMPKVLANTRTFEDVLNALEDKGLQVNSPVAGTDFIFGDTTIEILAPINSYEDLNNNSIVLRLTFQENSFLFTGDMEQEEESDIIQAGYMLESDLIKIGHHGSNTSTSQAFLDAVNPSYAIISVGRDNSYGHPNETVMKRITDKNIEPYRTDQNGTIQATSNGNEISFTFAKENVSNANIQQEPASSMQTLTKAPYYIGNKNSKKFHLPSCHSLPVENNREFFDTREYAVNAGFAACKNCNP